MAKFDAYEAITAQIIAKLEAGIRPWRMDWVRDGASLPPLPRRVTGEHYRGINVLLLWLTAQERGYHADTWMTFNQAKELGANVRKGEKGTAIVFFKALTMTKENPTTGQDEDHQVPCIRSYTVFNVAQIDNLPERYRPAAPIAAAPASLPGLRNERDLAAETALRSCGATIIEGGDRAFYAPGPDTVQMPDFERFHSAGGYLATLAHELCHWTGHKSRLGRNFTGQFGSKDYAAEELVAEIGAAFVGAQLGILGEHIDNHAAYIGSWLKALRNDKRAIFKAASLAQAAADMVLANAGAAELAQAA
ncbi:MULTISPECIES: ArdC family protein [unclassified Novosphingobium]|uniref:ArdC family protein n=1 Tax=unclassified Novosphingobium TaxID=2644732 RepID=UPI000D3184B7|nr:MULTISPECIES: zincin-like metallopeptidase domain-containing protein [unclassified Novosphingobium]PTR07880.1 antirestriction protein ArdC [Novosphingobium sp. GV055]PUB00693.1 antirestriction protein ArdC [Novosphingobium sp. GV061]PUB16102.1 antirestriction protein ArdC [Novosphingobium sp. GV079]PUB39567.1 antirestriction protein ArdC [Novosphingobium sp. GV027]